MPTRHWILPAAALLLTGCAKIVVVPVPPRQASPAEGVIYALPKTVVRVNVKIDRTSRSPARYALFAPIFAPEGEPVCKDAVCSKEKKISYSLADGATLATYGEPDPENVFLVKFSGKGAIDQQVSMTWNEAGLLSAASATVTNRTGDVVLSSLKLLAGLGTKAAFGANKALAGEDKCPDAPSPTDGWVIPELRKATAPWNASLIVSYCELSLKDRDALGSAVSATEDRRLLLAGAVKEYSDKVAPIASARASILTGKNTAILAPASLLAPMEAEIAQQLAALFLGSKKTKTWTGALDVRTVTAGAPAPLLRIDLENGICVRNAEIPPDAAPLPAEFQILAADRCSAAATPAVTDFALSVNFYPAPDRQLFTRIADVPTGDRSFRYRIPAQVKAMVTDGTKTYAAAVFSVAQLGTIISLPATRSSKMLSYDLGFIEATGGLKTFKLGTTGALDSGTVDALSGVGGTLLDARNTAIKNAGEVNLLTKQDTLLKLQDDICTIQKKYGLPCSVQP